MIHSITMQVLQTIPTKPPKHFLGGKTKQQFARPRNRTKFLHDHLGSTDGIVDSSGALYVGESFTAFGERRDPVDWVGDPSAGDLAKIADSTDRGYTDHISLEESSLIHMNGRVYDAEIGRFLSPDPYVFNPMNTQGFNRYAYVQNNPMRYTDPSGFELVTFGIVSTAFAIWDELFGLGGYEEPPPDFCKDNTRGCGGRAAGKISLTFSVDLYSLALDDEEGDEEEEGAKRRSPRPPPRGERSWEVIVFPPTMSCSFVIDCKGVFDDIRSGKDPFKKRGEDPGSDDDDWVDDIDDVIDNDSLKKKIKKTPWQLLGEKAIWDVCATMNTCQCTGTAPGGCPGKPGWPQDWEDMFGMKDDGGDRDNQ